MAQDVNRIIASIEKDYPQNSEELSIKNLSGHNFNFKTHLINQYIIGVTKTDPMSREIRHYKHHIIESLRDVTDHIYPLGWGYGGEEKAQMQSDLLKIAEHFKVDLDANKMIADLKIPRDDSGFYYIVITIVRYPIVYVQAEYK